MGDDIPPVVAPVINTGDELTKPIIDHTEKITRIEERQAQHEEKLFRELSELESRVQNASQEKAEELYRRISEIEAKIEALATKPVEVAEEAPGEAVEFVEPVVESSPAPPENIRKGLRHRRRARKKKE